MAIRAIVAVDPRGAIGREGRVPWRIPEDLRFFKRTTLGSVCVMGRRTRESLARPLVDRLNIVLSRSGRVAADDSVLVLPGVPQVLALHPYLARDVFVIGGAEVYRAFAPHIDEWIVTRVPDVAEGADTFLPLDLLAGYHLDRSAALTEGVVVEYLRPE